MKTWIWSNKPPNWSDELDDEEANLQDYFILRNIKFFKWEEYQEPIDLSRQIDPGRKSQVIEGLALRYNWTGTQLLINKKHFDSIEDCFEQLLKLRGSEELIYHLDLFRRYACLESVDYGRQDKALVYKLSK